MFLIIRDASSENQVILLMITDGKNGTILL